MRTKEECHLEALKYTSRNEFKKMAYGHYQTARNKSWLDDICDHMTPLMNNRTKEECHLEALKYTSRNEFKKMAGAIYAYCVKRKWLDDICGHMNFMIQTHSKEECHLEALKYNRRIDFANNSPKEYYSSRHNGWLDDICGHMTTLRYAPNVIYFWKARNMDVWKVGICHSDRVHKRIFEVSRWNNLEVEYVLYKCDSKCRDFEKLFLSLGSKCDMIDNNGSTEFRKFSKQQLNLIIDFFK